MLAAQARKLLEIGVLLASPAAKQVKHSTEELQSCLRNTVRIQISNAGAQGIACYSVYVTCSTGSDQLLNCLVYAQHSFSLAGLCNETHPLQQVPGMTTVRESKGRDVVLGDGKLVIPRDTPIFLPIAALHRSSAVYEHADDFIPERWLASDADYLSGTMIL